MERKKMLRLQLLRTAHRGDATIGQLFNRDTNTMYCHTLEDATRTTKVESETCIPEGVYQITLRTEGGMHAKYQKRYPDTHKGMLWLREIPNFKYVHIHIGNTIADTDGCVLVGMQSTLTENGATLGRSADAYEQLYALIAGSLLSGAVAALQVLQSRERMFEDHRLH